MTDYLELLFALIKQPVIQAILYVIGSLAAAKIADWIISTVLSRLANQTSVLLTIESSRFSIGPFTTVSCLWVWEFQ